MPDAYEIWLNEVRATLASINMPMDDWQGAWSFDFSLEFKAGTAAKVAAEMANRYWWHEQNKALKQDCRKNQGCWLPRDHQGACQPVEDRHE
jgi:hypothetical protein